MAGTTNQRYFATKKWDGSPALFVGTDPETGEFVMGDKGIFSKTKENRITDRSDVDSVKPNKKVNGKTVDYGPLRKKLKIAFDYLQDLNYGDRILQGDLLWTQGDGDSGFAVIDGVEYWTFKPNLLTYAVPADTELAQRMSSAKVGIVFHTTYQGGPTLQDMTATFGADVSELGHSDQVWYRDAGIKDVSGSVTLTQQEFDYLEEEITDLQSLLLAIGRDVFSWLEATASGHVIRDLIKIDINKMVRTGAMDQPGQYVDRFVSRLQDRITQEVAKLKTQSGQQRKQAAWADALKYITANRDNIEYVYMLFIKIQSVKDVLQRHYSAIRQINTFIQQPDGSYAVKPEEGVVIVDHLGRGATEAVKIVDRLEFSRDNFLKASRR